MKKSFFNKAIYGIAVIVGLFFILTLNAQKVDTLAYKFVYVNDSALAFNRTGSPMAEIESTFPIFEDKSASGKWVNLQLKILLDINSKVSLKKGVAASQKQYLKDYKEEMKGNENDNSASLDYMSTTDISVAYNEKGLLVLTKEIYDFSGGAHGNGGVYYSCYDVIHKKRLRRKDILTADSATLKKMVEQQFKRDNGLQPTDSLKDILFENYLPVNHNFYFDNKGLGFSYNPYEVASYAQGVIDVFLPYRNIKKYLTQAFKKLMLLN